jgi:hypothetical protein
MAAVRILRTIKTKWYLFTKAAGLGVAGFVLAGGIASAQSGSRSADPTPDPYFKTKPQETKWTQPYTPPSFSSDKKTESDAANRSKSNVSIPWGDQRSIVREKPTATKNQFVSTAMAQQDALPGAGNRVASLLDNEVTPKAAVKKDDTFEPGRVVAVVGGEPIFVGDMLFEASQLIEKFMPRAPQSVKEQQRKEVVKKLVKKYVDAKLLYVDVVSKLPDGVDVDAIVKQASKDFDDKVLPGMIESSGVRNVSEFDANLRGQGSSLRQLRTGWAKDQMAKYFLGEQLNINEYVSHQEMLDDYLANKEKYAFKAKAKWEQVLIRFDRSESREAAKNKVFEVADKIVYGANFGAMAKEHSHGFRARQGGLYESTSKGSLVLKAVDEAIFSTPVGELDIIESRDGFHIIRVIERTDEGFTPFIEAQVEIKKRLKTEKSNKAFEQHLEKVRRKIPVEYYPLD